MPDYRDIVSGTIDKVIDKVKDYTDGKTAREIYEEGMEKINGYGKRAKLTLDITGAKEQLKNAYVDVGRLYYDLYKEKHTHEFDELIETIDELRSEIIAKQQEIDAIKYAGSDISQENLEQEFGEVVDDSQN